MTRIQRIAARQAHPVPSRPHPPRGPFPPELYARHLVEADYVPQSDSGEPDLPDGATAQNGYRGVEYFRCTQCGLVLPDRDVPSHTC